MSFNFFTKKTKNNPNPNIYVQNPNNPKPVVPIVQQVTEPQTKRLLFDVAGIFYHEKELRKAGTISKMYYLSDEKLIASGKKKVHRYFFDGEMTFEEEPTNKHDKNAVKILLNGHLIGYVPAEFAPKMKKVIANKSITKVEYKVKGGEYKVIEGNYVDEDESEFICDVIVSYLE